MAPRVVAPDLVAWGRSPQRVRLRSVPPVFSIQLRSAATSVLQASSGAVHSALVPADITPATTWPTPKSTISGPPASPSQLFESVPGAPIGLAKFQHRFLAAGTSVQPLTTTEPVRLTPRSLATLSRPKPVILPGEPGTGRASRLIGVGATPSTTSERRIRATSDCSWFSRKRKPGLMLMLSTPKTPACWK